MNEEQIREIIRDELANLIRPDKYVFHRDLHIMDGKNIVVRGATGLKIGTATDQKLGFFNKTPVDQPDTVPDPNDVGATYSQSEVQDIVDKVKLIIDRLQELGLIQ